MTDCFDPDGNPLELMEWAEMFENRVKDSTSPESSWWRIGYDEVGDVTVSTVWLGLDHSFGEGPPLIFETLISGGEHSDDMDRYSTREQAVEGHARMLATVRND